jgi:hypothetical protein
MSNQPEALRLADELEMWTMGEPAAAELRRLYEAHDWQYRVAGDRLRRVEKLEAENEALLDLLKRAADMLYECHLRNEIHVAIDAAREAK